MNDITTSNTERLLALLEADDGVGLQSLMRDTPPGDNARLVTRLDRSEQRKLFTLLPAHAGTQLLRELNVEQAASVLRTLTPERAASLVEPLPSNEQVDVLTELNADAAAIVAQLPTEMTQRINRLSQYRGDSAGGLMVEEYLVYPDNAMVSEVVEDLRANAQKYTQLVVQYAYITDTSDRLVGVLRLRDLILLENNASVQEAMTHEPLQVKPDATLDELCRFFDRHSLLGVPVVDGNSRLLGVVLRMDVEEATSDRADRRILVMSGILRGEESRSMSWSSRVMRRAPWLCASLGLSLAAASVIGWYQETLSAAIALAVFLPVISGMGGNSGNQALAVSIRELSLGLVQPHEFLRVVSKEVIVGLANGFVLGIVVAMLCFAWQRNIRLSLVVGLAIALNVVVAACLGGILPLLLKRGRLDPALASGPVLAAVNDLCGFIFALALADTFLPKEAT